MFPIKAPAKGIFSETALKTIAWLQPSLGSLHRDLEISEVTIRTDQQLNALLAYAEKLPNIRQITIGGRVTNSGRELFVDSGLTCKSPVQ